MSISEDFMIIREGGDYLSREVTRHVILEKKLDACLPVLQEQLEKDEVALEIFSQMKILKDTIKDICKYGLKMTLFKSFIIALLIKS